ncbi:hypothetical protein ACL7TT_09065 [Microbulbifer sp. 2304DJ12-6]|uniref:hypothetical protein n=1 Tax=Microbulbifer sp. 2304DJ12-6 TaxID=3233340 RepID=UPI0039B0CF28
MSRRKGIALRLALVVVLAAAISFFFESSFYVSIVIATALGVFGEMVHMPENMPGAADNSEEKEVHPFKAMAIGALVVSILLVVDFLFPKLNHHGFSSYS